MFFLSLFLFFDQVLYEKQKKSLEKLFQQKFSKTLREVQTISQKNNKNAVLFNQNTKSKFAMPAPTKFRKLRFF